VFRQIGRPTSAALPSSASTIESTIATVVQAAAIRDARGDARRIANNNAAVEQISAGDDGLAHRSGTRWSRLLASEHSVSPPSVDLPIAAQAADAVFADGASADGVPASK
jgi:hypothetical protein